MQIQPKVLAGLASLILAAVCGRTAEPVSTNDYAAVEAILAKHCLDCHAAQEPDGKLVLESFETLMKGGESGPAIVSGKSGESLLVKAVETGLDRDGKKKLMPPGKRDKLKPEEIAVLKGWIDAGAPAPKQPTRPAARELVVPRIAPRVPPPRSIRALAFAPSPKLIALARPDGVELLSTESREQVRMLKGVRGAVNALAFSVDGQMLAAAAGEPALFGQATLWKVADGSLVRTIEAHNDALYAIAVSPDGKTLATGSYDQKIKLWNLASGELLHTLSAHNGAIYALAFRPDGKFLASASADRTIKLWNVATGKRVETLNQPLKEQTALAWSPDGKRLAGGGGDNRIRVWEISESAAETTNPLLIAKFAHEGALLALAWSPDGKTVASSADDQTVKFWRADQVAEKLALARQPDLATGLAFLEEGKRVAVGRLDGSVEFYETSTGKVVPRPAPELSGITPRGLRRGVTGRFTLTGKHLGTVTNLSVSSGSLQAALKHPPGTAALEAELFAPTNLARGAYELSAAGPGGQSGKVKVFVDDLPQIEEVAATNIAELPASFWGVLDPPGDSDEFSFSAKAGQMLVLDLAVRTVGSKLQNASVTLLDERGVPLANDSGFDGADRFTAFTIPKDGSYRARVADQMLGASPEHFYRLSVGELPVVTGVFPLSVPTNREAPLQLTGVNLPCGAVATLAPRTPGEADVLLDPERYRARRSFKVLVADGPQGVEAEPNDKPAEATPFVVPGGVNGRMDRPGDADLFRFEVNRGQRWILETDAARRGSPVDTRIEVLWPDGKPVPRLRLQAVRNTAVNFRGVDSNAGGMRLDHYEEMELNQYLYLSGEVMRLFRMPQGPDSEMLMFTSAGKRRAYFDTSSTAHALDEQGFIVEPRSLEGNLAATGLPVFTVWFENDDDADRRMGSDSKVFFDPPRSGAYLVRVTETRSQGGDTFAYRLVAREAKPDFTVSLNGANSSVAAGSGQSFTVNAERLDGFEGEIRVEIGGVPDGFTVSTPIIIEAGHTEAKGTIFAAPGVTQSAGTNGSLTRITATAVVEGRTVTKSVPDPGALKLADAPKLYVSLEPYAPSATNSYRPVHPAAEPIELTIAPGGRIPAWLKIHRNGHKDLVTFFVENLPHGVIVDDIGLNGVLIPKDENERQIFLSADSWVTEQDRWCYAVEQQAGRQTSRPVLLKVRKPGTTKSASAK